MYKEKKLGLGIIAFEGTEHLYNILSELRDIADYIVIGLQTKSYLGVEIDASDVYECEQLVKEGLADKILYINDLNPKDFPRIQETEKRNRIAQEIENNGCDYQLIIDSDEYYVHNTFKRAWEEIIDNNYEMTYCQYVNYFHDYMHYLVYPFSEGTYVPFIAKAKYRFSWQCTDFTLPSDPTRRYVRPKAFKMQNGVLLKDQKGNPIFDHYLVDYYIFPWKELKMHHLSWIRSDIRKKLNNWSSKTYFDDYNILIDKAVDRFNNFSDDNMSEPAVLLFNTPGHKVDIRKFKKQYIHPKIDFHKRVCHIPREKKILMLVMSCNKPEFLKEEKIVRQTWAKEIFEGKYPNIELYFYRGTDKDSYIDKENNIIYIHNQDMRQTTYSKTMECLASLESKFNIDYEYIVKTNMSTYINVSLLNEFISQIYDDSKIYGLELSSNKWSNNVPYLRGNFMIIHKNTVSKLMKYVINIDSADDTMMGISFNNYLKANELHWEDFFLPVNDNLLNNNSIDIKSNEDELKGKIVISVHTDIDLNNDLKGMESKIQELDMNKMIKLHEIVSNIKDNHFIKKDNPENCFRISDKFYDYKNGILEVNKLFK